LSLIPIVTEQIQDLAIQPQAASNQETDLKRGGQACLPDALNAINPRDGSY
jgi:hypothetical protein